MPRANPPPSASPIAGTRCCSYGPLPESSRPKACMERMIFPSLFTAPPRLLNPVPPNLPYRPLPLLKPLLHILRCHNLATGCRAHRCQTLITEGSITDGPVIAHSEPSTISD